MDIGEHQAVGTCGTAKKCALNVQERNEGSSSGKAHKGLSEVCRRNREAGLRTKQILRRMGWELLAVDEEG